MSHPKRAIRTMKFLTLGVMVATALAMQPASGEVSESGCTISFIGHEVTEEMTRVILHASGPIDYRGGSLHGDQVILDLANASTTLATPVVELGTPEVDRAVIGPEIDRDGIKVLKVRLTGVKARSHKVKANGNELHIDLVALKGSRGKGLPTSIDNKPEVTTERRLRKEPEVEFARADDVTLQGEEALMPARRSSPKVKAVTAGEITVERIDEAEAAGPAKVEETRTAEPEAAIEEVVVEAQPAAAPANENVVAKAMTTRPMPLYTMAPAEETPAGRVLNVAVGRSLTLDTGLPVKRVSISNPAMAEPVAISPTQLLINGLTPGTGTLVLWPDQGTAIIYELIVHIDAAALSRQMQVIFPGEQVRVQTSKDTIVLTGPVSGSGVAEKMVALASDYSGKVVDHMYNPGDLRRQVMLKVKFAEVGRSALTELGSVLHHVNPEFPRAFDRGSTGTGQFSPPGGNLLNNPVGPELSFDDAINLSFFEKSLDLGLFITALKEKGLFQTLAEPTLIAADGQDASFLAGGEFPVPIAQPGAGFTSITVEWKKFGISLDFTPKINNDGTIIMRVKPEVSALDFSNGIFLEGFRIPALTVRRAETEVELKDGQSFAIAGLFDRNLLQTKSKIPVLSDIPLLGRLFKSKGLEKNRTELLVLVTPTIVEPLGTGEEPALEMPENFDLEDSKTAE